MICAVVRMIVGFSSREAGSPLTGVESPRMSASNNAVKNSEFTRLFSDQEV